MRGCVFWRVQEAPLPLLLGEGFLGNDHVPSRALAGLAGLWEVFPGSLISTEFPCPGLVGKLWFS